MERREIAELVVDRRMAALGRADCIRATGIVGSGLELVVAALAVGSADWMDRRQIENVEPHLAHIRQPGDHVVERAVPLHLATHRTREELVPSAVAPGETVDDDFELAV